VGELEVGALGALSGGRGVDGGPSIPHVSPMTHVHWLVVLAFAVAGIGCSPRPVLGTDDSSPGAPGPKTELAASNHTTMQDLIELRAGTDWQIVNDGVMGGRSESRFRVEQGRGVFAGNLSPDNGGGFASVRTELKSRAGANVVAVAVRVLGDGKTYQLLKYGWIADTYLTYLTFTRDTDRLCVSPQVVKTICLVVQCTFVLRTEGQCFVIG